MDYSYRPPKPSPVQQAPKGARPPIHPSSPSSASARSTWNGWPSAADIPFDPPSAPASPRPASARSPPRPLPLPPIDPSSAEQAPIYDPRIRSASAVHLSRTWSNSPTWSASPMSPYASFYNQPSNVSFRSSIASFDTFDIRTPTVVADELEHQRNLEEDGIRRFQSGDIPIDDAEWHRLVPREAVEAFPKKEVQRQSIIFEIIKSERDYVADLAAVTDVFISSIYQASPPPLSPRSVLDGFILEVFSNLTAIRAHHERMLTKLFERQREQHPIINSIADIVLDGALVAIPDYEVYIKHYPLAEARHRRELKHNPAYATILTRSSEDPRIRRRDVITFLSRPVTRLPRLSLLLENMAKQTESDHTDTQESELILGVLRNFISSTQPGIAAADAKVKFWSLCETLVFRRGEILDMDLYDEKRTLVHSGPLARRRKTEYNTHAWSDLYVGLLDNYLLLTQQETRMGNVKHVVVSRPIPMQFLRLASFSSPPENRRNDRSNINDLDRSSNFPLPIPLPVRAQVSVWPFTIFHAFEKSQRRYTLYAESEAKRTKWHEALVDAVSVMQVQQEANRWFATNTLSSGFFRLDSKAREKDRAPGPIICAASFNNGKRDLLAVGCPDGVWVGFRGDGKSYRKVLDLKQVTGLATLRDFDQLVVHNEGRLVSYSLEKMSHAAELELPALRIWSSFERISKPDETVAFFRVGEVAGHLLVVYAVRRPLRQTTIHALEAVRNPADLTPTETVTRPKLFAPYGSSFYVPKDAFDIVLLQKKIAVCTERGLTIIDPLNLSSANVTVVPDFSQAVTDKAMASLKSRCEISKPLGIVRSGESELLVVYDEFGCYITKHGIPSRRSGYLRWEIKATAVIFRPPHVLLFDGDFMEIRDAPTGRLEQVIEGKNMRLAGDTTSSQPLLVAKEDTNSEGGSWDTLVELVETQPLTADQMGLWDEWGLW